MKIKLFLAASLFLSCLAFSQETPQKTSEQKKESKKQTQKKAKFVNAIDPICEMKTDENMKHSAVYNNKTYGFCSNSCKDEFLKNPDKYVKQ